MAGLPSAPARTRKPSPSGSTFTATGRMSRGNRGGPAVSRKMTRGQM